MTSALLLTLLLATGAPDPDLDLAERSLGEGRFESILSLLERARRKPLTVEQRRRSYELEALTHSAFNAEAQAIAAYRNVLGLDPIWSPPARSSPKVLDAFQQAKALGPIFSANPPPVSEVAVSDSPGLVRSPWFWTGVGVLVVGAATSAYVLSRPPRVPEGNLGRFPLQ